MQRVLVVGFFSFKGGRATAGDLLARDLVVEWLRSANLNFDVAAEGCKNSADLQTVDPFDYSHLAFVCGPCFKFEFFFRLTTRFSHCQRIAVNVSMIENLAFWNPFHVVLERDSDRVIRPDITFSVSQGRVPVTGVIQVHRQWEYGRRGQHEAAARAFAKLIAEREMAVVEIDTILPVNRGRLRTPREVESLIARMDVVLTTRLHGMVFALKNGVPALVIDPIESGAKVLKQARVIGWPIVYTADALDPDELHRAFDYCLTSAARDQAAAAYRRASELLEGIKEEFLEAVRA